MGHQRVAEGSDAAPDIEDAVVLAEMGEDEADELAEARAVDGRVGGLHE